MDYAVGKELLEAREEKNIADRMLYHSLELLTAFSALLVLIFTIFFVINNT